jgi:hypothetical protein
VPKLFCPSCMKPVTVPDDFAGGKVTCPSCGKEFDGPAKYTPTVLTEPNPPPTPEPTMSPDPIAERPTPPPGLIPPAATLSPSPTTSAPPLPAGYTRSRGISFNPRVIAWLPAILLLISFLCTFAPWVGMYLGGSAAYSQGPWSAMVGAANPNQRLVQSMQMSQKWYGVLKSDWELMVPYLLSLMVATLLALADRGFSTFDPRRIPPLAGLWNWRKLIILVLASLAFALAFIQVCNGFGMERAVRKTVSEQFAEDRANAGGDRAKLAQIEYREDQEFAKYSLERTTWLYLGLLCNLLAVVAMFIHTSLERRGDKPPPRLVLQY